LGGWRCERRANRIAIPRQEMTKWTRGAPWGQFAASAESRRGRGKTAGMMCARIISPTPIRAQATCRVPRVSRAPSTLPLPPLPTFPLGACQIPPLPICRRLSTHAPAAFSVTATTLPPISHELRRSTGPRLSSLEIARPCAGLVGASGGLARGCQCWRQSVHHP
jgi:hypothetical protein